MAVLGRGKLVGLSRTTGTVIAGPEEEIRSEGR